MTEQPVGPRCGNNPNAQLTPGDRQAVEEFRTYLTGRAALRDRIAEALAEQFTSPGHYDQPVRQRLDQGMMTHFTAEDGYPSMAPVAPHEAADAVLAVLPEPAERDSLGREADRLRKDWVAMRTRAEQAEAAVERVRSVLESEAVAGRSALDYRGLVTSALMAGEAQQPCTRCHGTAIDPDNSAVEYRDGIVRGVPEPCSNCQMGGEAQQPETQLPFIHVDDDGDKLHIGALMASTYDGEAPVVSVAAEHHAGDDHAVVYLRPERVDEVIAALRSASQQAEALPAAVSQPDGEA